MKATIRLITTQIAAARQPPLGLFDTSVIKMRCWPTDIDIFLEMNNGRILTLYDLGRFALSRRIGLVKVLSDNGWGVAVAGASTRYRKRILPFQSFELRTRLLAWDARFFYLEQAMWRGETACNHGLLRTAVVEKGRAVPTDRVAEAMGMADAASPPLPDWCQAWAEADQARPWPPEI